MMNKKEYILGFFILAGFLLFNVSCERNFENPWDSKANFDPSDWAPENVKIDNFSITEKKLTWTYEDQNIEGFKLDRKKGDEDWHVGYKIFGKEIRSWNELDIIPIPGLIYSYRLFAYAGEYSSTQISRSFNAQIPEPSNLTASMPSITAVILTWEDNSSGEDGYKIDRKVNQGEWEIGYVTLNASQSTFTDDNLDLNNNLYTYKLYAYAGQYSSQKTEASASNLCGNPFTDIRDGKQYETVKIGNQCWMKENVAYLPYVDPSGSGSWDFLRRYVYDYNGSSVSEAKATSNYQTYGVLYNWTSALSACPEGWHLPSKDEWWILLDTLGGTTAGGKMKETGLAYWNSPNTGATNSSGFSALGAGKVHNYEYKFLHKGIYATWWSSSESITNKAYYQQVGYDYESGNYWEGDKDYGLSVRCVRDE